MPGQARRSPSGSRSGGQKERNVRRRDVRILDAYAWALHANGRRAEARKQMQAALAVGSRDPEMVERAERIGVKVARTVH